MSALITAGIPTPVSVANGGTASTTAAAALTALGAAAIAGNTFTGNQILAAGQTLSFASGTAGIGAYSAGTTAPSITVSDATGTTNLLVLGRTSSTSGETTVIRMIDRSGVIQFSQGSSVSYWNPSNGLIGIGKTTAAKLLDVGGTLNVDGIVTLKTGGSSAYASAGGTIFNHSADGASASVDGTEDTLYTDTIAASSLAVNGDKICGYYQLAIVGHAVSTDRIRLYYGGTAIFDTAALNFPISASMTIAFELIRVSSSVVRCAVFATTNSATLIPYSQYTEVTSLTLTNTQIIVLKDISTGTNSAVGDVTAKLGKIMWQSA